MSSLIKMVFFKQGETYYESDSNNFFSLKKKQYIYTATMLCTGFTGRGGSGGYKQ